MRLILLRHGLTEANERHLYFGSTDLPLSERGREALRRSDRLLPPVQDYYTSGMNRTEETLHILVGDVPHQKLPGLRELNFGIFELRGYDELRFDPAYQAWITGDNEKNVCPGGESAAAVTERALAALDPVLRRDRDALCVTHGGVIAGLLLHWFPGAGNRYTLTPPPGGWAELLVEKGLPRAFSLSD